MKFVVIGLGSMGKRRIRNLIANGQKEIVATDLREDRQKEAEEKYGIRTVDISEFTDELKKADAAIISVPPDRHMEYAHKAFELGKHCFIEASVVDEGIKELIEKSKTNNKIKICPSCTLRFHPSIKLIKSIVESGDIGKLSNFCYHSGQYLPDWHPWENVSDFYVSKMETGGCREIVPFELTWLNWVFGPVSSISGFKGKTVDVGADIDDVYAMLLRYKSGLIGTLLVDVVSRYAVRRITLNGEKGQIIWDWNSRRVEVYNSQSEKWQYFEEPQGCAETGYNSNIIEEMYINEIKSFIDAINGKSDFPSTLEEDHDILKLLYAAEDSDQNGAACFLKDR